MTLDDELTMLLKLFATACGKSATFLSRFFRKISLMQSVTSKLPSLSEVRKVIDWEIEWTEARVEGGDKLRDEWREKCRHNVADDTPPSAV